MEKNHQKLWVVAVCLISLVLFSADIYFDCQRMSFAEYNEGQWQEKCVLLDTLTGHLGQHDRLLNDLEDTGGEGKVEIEQLLLSSEKTVAEDIENLRALVERNYYSEEEQELRQTEWDETERWDAMWKETARLSRRVRRLCLNFRDGALHSAESMADYQNAMRILQEDVRMSARQSRESVVLENARSEELHASIFKAGTVYIIVMAVGYAVWRTR